VLDIEALAGSFGPGTTSAALAAELIDRVPRVTFARQ
jgi:hypothetical protein